MDQVPFSFNIPDYKEPAAECRTEEAAEEQDSNLNRQLTSTEHKYCLQLWLRPIFIPTTAFQPTLLRVLRLERDLRLVDHHSGVSVGGDGGGGLGVDIAATPGVLDFMDQRDDDQGHRDVEHQVQDRDPVLEAIRELEP